MATVSNFRFRLKADDRGGQVDGGSRPKAVFSVAEIANRNLTLGRTGG